MRRPAAPPPATGCGDPGARGRIRGAATTLTWCIGLLVLGRILWLVGRGPLAPPPLTNGSDLQRWLDTRTSVTAAFALLRIVALAIVVYLLVLTALALCARLLHLPRLLRAVELSSLPAARRAISAVAGLGLGASTTIVAFSPAIGAPPRPAATARPAADAWSVRRDRLVIEQVRVGPLVLERVAPPSPTVARDRPTPLPVASASTPPPAPPARPSVAPVTTWTVRTGDHLWSIAERHLWSTWARPVTDHEIDPYWRTLIELNRPVLPDPTNPDLLFTGTVLTLPPVPADPQAALAPEPASRPVAPSPVGEPPGPDGAGVAAAGDPAVPARVPAGQPSSSPSDHTIRGGRHPIPLPETTTTTTQPPTIRTTVRSHASPAVRPESTGTADPADAPVVGLTTAADEMPSRPTIRADETHTPAMRPGPDEPSDHDAPTFRPQPVEPTHDPTPALRIDPAESGPAPIPKVRAEQTPRTADNSAPALSRTVDGHEPPPLVEEVDPDAGPGSVAEDD